jgi:hypothetical protein
VAALEGVIQRCRDLEIRDFIHQQEMEQLQTLVQLNGHEGGGGLVQNVKELGPGQKQQTQLQKDTPRYLSPVRRLPRDEKSKPQHSQSQSQSQSRPGSQSSQKSAERARSTSASRRPFR